MADEHIFAVPEDPKITLLRCKLALLIGPDECPEYDTIKAQRPQALEEPWSDDMSGSIKHVVFNNKTFAMFEVTAGQAYGLTHQRDPISCGENITIYLDDELFRDWPKGKTMERDLLRRTEGISKRAVKSQWYYWMTGWINKINGGPGFMIPSPSGKVDLMKPKKDASMRSPKGDVSTSSPKGDMSTSSPKGDASTSSPTEDVSTSSPKVDMSTSSPKGGASKSSGERA